MTAAASIPVHNSGAGKPNFPPDITYNPDPATTVPYSTHSATAAKNIAAQGGQKPAYNHRGS